MESGRQAEIAAAVDDVSEAGDRQQQEQHGGGVVGGVGMMSWIQKNPVTSVVKDLGKATMKVGKATVQAGKVTTEVAMSGVHQLGSTTANVTKSTVNIMSKPVKNWVTGGDSSKQQIDEETTGVHSATSSTEDKPQAAAQDKNPSMPTTNKSSTGEAARKVEEEEESSGVLSAAVGIVSKPVQWIADWIDDDDDDDDHKTTRAETSAKEKGVQNASTMTNTQVDHVKREKSKVAGQRSELPDEDNDSSFLSTLKDVVHAVTKPVVQGTGVVLNKAVDVAQVITEPVMSGTGAVLDAAWDGVGAITGLGEGDHDNENEDRQVNTIDESEGEAALPADEQLQQMEPILSKQWKQISVKQWHDSCWSSKDLFYGPWLTADDNKNVVVGEWRTAEDEKGPIVNEWDKEVYDRKRSISFQFKSGFGDATVKETQYIRLLGEDRCVLAMHNETTGVPYADYFNVEVRWVTTRVGKADLSIKVGVFVVFVKQTIMAGSIKSATMEDVPAGLLSLYEEMKKLLGAEEGGSGTGTDPDSDGLGSMNEQKKSSLWDTLLAYFDQQSSKDLDDIDTELRAIDSKLQIFKSIKVANTPAEKTKGINQAISDIQMVERAIDAALLQMLSKTQEQLVVPKTTEAAATSDEETSRVSASASNVGFKPMRNIASGIGAVVDWLDPREAEEDAPGFDKTLSGMDVELDKTFTGVSPKDLFDKCLARSHEPGSLYENWLKETGKTNIRIEAWVTSAEDSTTDFIDPWNSEKYDWTRKVTFTYQRFSFLLHGPRTVECDITQYCRLDKNSNRIVWASTIDTKKGDEIDSSFSIHCRWIMEGIEEDPTTVLVKAGVFVIFTKPSSLEGKIRAGATQEFAHATKSFYECVRGSISSGSLEQAAVIDVNSVLATEPSTIWNIVHSLPTIISDSSWQSGYLVDEGEVSLLFRRVERKLRALRAYLGRREDRSNNPTMNSIISQLVVARETLDSVIDWQVSHGGVVAGGSSLSLVNNAASLTVIVAAASIAIIWFSSSSPKPSS